MPLSVLDRTVSLGLDAVFAAPGTGLQPLRGFGIATKSIKIVGIRASLPKPAPPTLLSYQSFPEYF